MEKRFRLPKEFTERWTAALRSGEYEQTHDQLYDEKEGGYCCLGVVLRMQGVPNRKMLDCGVIAHKDSGYCKNSTKFAPKELYGMPGENEFIDKLTTLNDYEGADFEQIADWIDDNVEKY